MTNDALLSTQTSIISAAVFEIKPIRGLRLSPKIFFLPGCTQSFETSSLLCSRLNFYELAFINQYISNLQYVGLFPSDQAQFADFRFFERSKPDPSEVQTQRGSGQLLSLKLKRENFNKSAPSTSVDSAKDPSGSLSTNSVTPQNLLSGYSFKIPPLLQVTMSISLEFSFEHWRNVKKSGNESAVHESLRAQLLSILNTNGQTMLQVSIVETPNFTMGSASQGDSGRQTSPRVLESVRAFYLRLSLGKGFVRLSEQLMLVPNDLSPPGFASDQPETTVSSNKGNISNGNAIDTKKQPGNSIPVGNFPIRGNTRLTIFIAQSPGQLHANLFLVDRDAAGSGETQVQHAFYSDRSSSVLFKGGVVQLLSESMRSLSGFGLERVLVSNSPGDLVSGRVVSSLSDSKSVCSQGECRVKGIPLSCKEDSKRFTC